VRHYSIRTETCEPGDYVFRGRSNGAALSVRMVRIILRSACKRAGIERPVCVMSLRHSYAVRRLENGLNLRELQQELGHASVRTTDPIFGGLIRNSRSRSPQATASCPKKRIPAWHTPPVRQEVRHNQRSTPYPHTVGTAMVLPVRNRPHERGAHCRNTPRRAAQTSRKEHHCCIAEVKPSKY